MKMKMKMKRSRAESTRQIDRQCLRLREERDIYIYIYIYKAHLGCPAEHHELPRGASAGRRATATAAGKRIGLGQRHQAVAVSVPVFVQIKVGKIGS
jgi:hypothetical protein